MVRHSFSQAEMRRLDSDVKTALVGCIVSSDVLLLRFGFLYNAALLDFFIHGGYFGIFFIPMHHFPRKDILVFRTANGKAP